MLLSEKLHNLIKQSKYKRPSTLWKALKKEFGKDAIGFSTLYAGLRNESTLRNRTLYQIGHMLDIEVVELRKGTEAEIKDNPLEEGVYRYNEKAYSRILNIKLPYTPSKIMLKPNGRTTLEQDDPAKKEPCTKFVFVLYGAVRIVTEDKLNKNSQVVTKNNYYCFDSKLPHHFENNSSKKAAGFLVIHNPKFI